MIDAKYKAHLAELDERSWHTFTMEAREVHRGDIHQILAYASLFDTPAGEYFGERHGVWIFGRGAMRFVCLELRLHPPRWSRAQGVAPSHNDLVAKVQEQKRTSRPDLEKWVAAFQRFSLRPGAPGLWPRARRRRKRRARST